MMEHIITDDGSETFRSIEFDEPYHSKSGAVEEAYKKYALPLKIWEKNNLVIFDVCSGMGYNAAAAIDVYLEKHKDEGNLKIYLYEFDLEIIKKTMEVNPAFKNYDLIKSLVKQFFESQQERLDLHKDDVEISLILRKGDARELIAMEKDKADFVFYDPFSPKKHPEMWEESVFQTIFSKMKNKSILATYSYARIVRDNLKNVGFRVTAGPTIGRRSPSTIAFKDEN